MSNKQNPFADIFKSFGDNLKGTFDIDQLITTNRLNAKAASDAAKAAAEGSQAIARRQVEIWQENAERASQFIKDSITSAKSPEASISRQAEFAKSATEAAIANARELFEIASKSNSETIDLLNKRLNEVISEVDWDGFSANSNNKKNEKNDKKNAA